MENTLRYLRRTINNYPTLEQMELTQLFDDMEAEIMSAIELLVRYTKFVDHSLLDLAGQIAGGLTRGRSIYKRSLVEPKAKKTEEEEPPQINPPTIMFFSTADQELLAQMLLLVSTSDRQQVLELIPKLKISRALYEQFLETFLTLTLNYSDDILLMSKLRLEERYEELGDIEKRIAQVEISVEGDAWTLYNVREAVEKKMRRVKQMRERVSKAYLRLAWRISTDLSQQSTTSQQLDNYQNGAIGLVRAISYYDQNSGNRFATFATWWVRQAILLHLKETANFVHLPISTWQIYTWLESVVKPKIMLQEGRVTTDRLIQESGYTRAQLDNVYACVKLSQVYSLDYPISDDHETLLMSIVPDPRPEEEQEETETQLVVRQLLDKLNSEELRVICLHHGLLEYLPEGTHTVKDIELERVRQMLAARCLGESK